MSKKLLVVIAAMVLIFGGFIWMGRGHNAASPSMTFATVTKDVSAGARLYDVRTAQEFAEGHFAGAINFPVDQMHAGTFPSIAKDTKIYVYCHSGNRSSQAVRALKDAGFTTVTDLGGLSKVQATGGSLTK